MYSIFRCVALFSRTIHSCVWQTSPHKGYWVHLYTLEILLLTYGYSMSHSASGVDTRYMTRTIQTSDALKVWTGLRGVISVMSCQCRTSVCTPGLGDVFLETWNALLPLILFNQQQRHWNMIWDTTQLALTECQAYLFTPQMFCSHFGY